MRFRHGARLTTKRSSYVRATAVMLFLALGYWVASAHGASSSSIPPGFHIQSMSASTAASDGTFEWALAVTDGEIQPVRLDSVDILGLPGARATTVYILGAHNLDSLLGGPAHGPLPLGRYIPPHAILQIRGLYGGFPGSVPPSKLRASAADSRLGASIYDVRVRLLVTVNGHHHYSLLRIQS